MELMEVTKFFLASEDERQEKHIEELLFHSNQI